MTIEIKIEDDAIRYYKSGLLHREDGPAVEFNNGDKFWYINGKRHREDGPAVILSNGDEDYWINGKFIKSENNDVQVA